MMQTDVKSTTISASASDEAVFAGPARIKGMVVTYPAGPATLTLKDGSGGTTKFTFNGPTGAGAINILIPGEGIRCDSGIYATTTSGTYASVFYG
jgi:hypothetical protein